MSGHVSGHRGPGADHAAPTVGSTAALLDIKAVGRNPVTDIPANPHFARIGGEAAVRRVVEHFYQYMDTLPEARVIRDMHPPELGQIKEVLYKFLVGWMGGPQLYAAERGQPRLRRKHLPFQIGDAERDAWMTCMTRALADVVTDQDLREELTRAFHKTASFLRNQKESP